MTTYISLASSATMFPVGNQILTSELTPEMIKARLAYPELCVSALNNDHKATIDAIRRRYDLDLPLSIPGPDGRAPQIKLISGDELFIVQASLPRLAAGEVHSDETIANAPISFLRWRVPVHVEVRAPEGPRGLPQTVFDQVIDHAYSIALWRGETQLKSVEELLHDFDKENKECDTAWEAWSDSGFEEGSQQCQDCYLEFADMAYKAFCIRYAATVKNIGSDELRWKWYDVVKQAEENVDIWRVIDAMLAKYGRRASGELKDLNAERALVAK